MDCSFTLLVGVLGVSRVGAVPPIVLLICCPEADALLFADAMPASSFWDDEARCWI